MIVPRLTPFLSGYGDPGGGSTVNILSNLKAYWKLDEAAGTDNAVDSSGGGYTLTQTGSPAPGVGIISGCRVFNSTAAQRLSIASASGDGVFDVTGVSFQFWMWLKPATHIASRRPIQKDNGASARQYSLQASATANQYIWRTFDGTTTQRSTVTVTTTLGAWNFLTFGVDLSVGTFGTSFMSVNNGAYVTNALTGAIGNNAQPFGLGGSSGITSIDGSIDEVGFRRGGVLNSSEVTYLYNSGAGRTYPFT